MVFLGGGAFFYERGTPVQVEVKIGFAVKVHNILVQKDVTPGGATGVSRSQETTNPLEHLGMSLL